MKIYLASKSPRRQQLLKQIHQEFEVLKLDVPEILVPGESAEHYSARITEEKLTAAWTHVLASCMKTMPVLCADTEVVFEGRIFGKPSNYEEGFRMLKQLSGQAHQVLTSIGLRFSDYQKIVTHSSTVYFSPMSEEDIHHYLSEGDYKDKAGAYGIQSSIGQFISKIEGCFYSIIGLPLNSLRELLNDLAKNP